MEPSRVTFKVYPTKVEVATSEGDLVTYYPLAHERTGWDVLSSQFGIEWYMRCRIRGGCEILSLASTKHHLRHVLVDVNPTTDPQTFAETFTLSCGKGTLLDGYVWPSAN